MMNLRQALGTLALAAAGLVGVGAAGGLAADTKGEDHKTHSTPPAARTIAECMLSCEQMAALRPESPSLPDIALRADESVERTGTVDAWHVLANGTVAVRLVGRDEKQAFELWFVTPGDKNETTRFEHQVLYTALSFASSRQDLTVAHGARTDKSGKTVKEAIPMEAIMSSVLPSEDTKDKKPGATATRDR